MTTHERIALRKCVHEAGFLRDYGVNEPNMYDRVAEGIYKEVWLSKTDRTKVTIEWDRRTDK